MKGLENALKEHLMTELEVRIKQGGEGLATIEEITLLHKFQEEIETRGIGKDLGGGTGLGEMDILVEVADSQAAKRRLRQLAQEFGIADRTTIREFPDTST
jgi:hypothetical protein